MNCNMKWPSLRLLLGLLFSLSLISLSGCNLKPKGEASQGLEVELRAHLSLSQAAQATAAAHWDALILGEGRNCAEGLPLPPSLTQNQSSNQTSAHILNIIGQADVALADSARMWDTLCSDSDNKASPTEVNRAYLAVKRAGELLQQAEDALSAWNP